MKNDNNTTNKSNNETYTIPKNIVDALHQYINDLTEKNKKHERFEQKLYEERVKERQCKSCSDCARYWNMNCRGICHPLNCGDFIDISSNEIKEYIKWKIIGVMRSLDIPESVIYDVEEMNANDL